MLRAIILQPKPIRRAEKNVHDSESGDAPSCATWQTDMWPSLIRRARLNAMNDLWKRNQFHKMHTPLCMRHHPYSGFTVRYNSHPRGDQDV